MWAAGIRPFLSPMALPVLAGPWRWLHHPPAATPLNPFNSAWRPECARGSAAPRVGDLADVGGRLALALAADRIALEASALGLLGVAPGAVAGGVRARGGGARAAALGGVV